MSHTRSRRGSAFVLALLVVTVLAAVALVFARQMRTEALAATNSTSHNQARWIARGALDAVRGDLAQSLSNGEYPMLDTVEPMGGEMAGGYYFILGRDADPETYTFGLIGEASRLNLNTASSEELIELPGVSEDLAAAIIDWRDGDSDVTPGGAESDYYSTRRPSYSTRNAAFESIGELMLVKGMTRQILTGEDANLNSVLDPNEADSDENPPNDNGDNTLNPGLTNLLTVHSLERNAMLTGADRININAGNQANQVIALLNVAFDEKRVADLLASITTQRPYANLLDFYVRANLTTDEFDQLYDKLTTQGGNNLRGLVDIYTAPAQVIDAIEGMDPGDGELIVAGRPTLEAGQQPGGLAWLTDLIGNEKAIQVGGRLTNHSRQFTVDIVAVTKDGRSFCRLRAVIDTRSVTEETPRLPTILRMDDLTHLGWPLSPAILEELRRSNTLPDESIISRRDSSMRETRTTQGGVR